jgi:hypothetical protein
MPKVNYTAAKGLFQEAGSGIDLATDTSGLNARQKTETLSTVGTYTSPTKVLTAADSGTVFFCDISTVSVVVQLPTASAGLNYRLILSVASDDENAKDLVIYTGNDAVDIQGNAMVAGSHVEIGSTNSVIAFDGSAANDAGAPLTVGDFFDISCDGTDWYVFGSAVQTDSVAVGAGKANHTVP